MNYLVSSGKFSIKKSMIRNLGFGLIEVDESIEKLEETATKKYRRYLSSELNTQLSTTTANSTHASLYFTNEDFTYEYSSPKDASTTGRLMLVENKKKKEIPEGFVESAMLSKS